MPYKPKKSLLDYQSKYSKFDTLMQFRVKHILLVSSSYDSYVLEEDGQLTDLIYNEYLELNLTVTPHVKRVSTAQEAFEVLENQEVDLILIFKRVSDIDVLRFGQKVKRRFPGLPVILLAYHERELELMLTDDYHKAIDQTFVWTGDVKILLSIIKLIEDRINIDHDTAAVGVRVIIIVEDSIKFYSSYLPLLYHEIMSQTRALMADSLNISDQILRMRARPKMLLAKNYEEAQELFVKYKKYLLAVICDFRFQINNEFDDEAGIKLIQQFRKEYADLPVLMQSTNEKNAVTAYANNAGFISKRSTRLIKEIRNFIKVHFGFGDFVFVDPQTGRELARANDYKSMERCITKVDNESLLYHGSRNHFSNWLMARTEFDLADRLRPMKVSEFSDVEELRTYLLKTFKIFRHEKQKGEIIDFARERFDLESDFVRIGGGSLGGKGRGLAYINALLNQYHFQDIFDDVQLKVPLTVILGTEVFDDFIEQNNLHESVFGDISDEEIAELFLKAEFPDNIIADFDALLENIHYPLAIRSSSLLEDSHLQTFAGIYETFMLPNNHQDQSIRRLHLETAVKEIYASTFYQNAKAYHQAANNRIEEEKMAVIIQKAVGNYHHGRFYPSFSGVALSYNYYSLDNVEPEDGVVYTALGFGKTIVEGMNCLRFSPSYPEKLPQMSTIKDMLNNSQKEFFAIDLTTDEKDPLKIIENDGLHKYSTTLAEEDGTLAPICSTYSSENDRVYTGSTHKGTRIVTFAPILKTKTFPLSKIVKFLLRFGSKGLNCPVEIEFAVNLNKDKVTPSEFYFLQIRPMMKETQADVVSLKTVNDANVIGKSYKTLGNMSNREISNIIIVNPATFDRGDTVSIANEVGQLNQMMVDEQKQYLLVGPGRWGTTERWLGIPVSWSQISGAKVIAEVAYGDFAPDPSFGTHFFQNLTAFQMGYFTINPNAHNGFLDFDWILNQNIIKQTKSVMVVSLKKPLEILIDGRTGNGIISKQL